MGILFLLFAACVVCDYDLSNDYEIQSHYYMHFGLECVFCGASFYKSCDEIDKVAYAHHFELCRAVNGWPECRYVIFLTFRWSIIY